MSAVTNAAQPGTPQQAAVAAALASAPPIALLRTRPSFTGAAWLMRRAREITGCPRENGPGFGLPSETRQNARSIVGMPACDTHPGEGAPGGFVKAGPRPGVAPGNGASCPSRALQGSSAHPLDTRPWVVIREFRQDHPRRCR
jgi:hypothetical protein